MWLLTTPTRRTGEPDFGSTHSARQRACMKRGRCQVCGRDGRSVVWVVPEHQRDEALWEGHFLLNPPVCVECFDFSRSVCPFLRAHPSSHVFTGRSKVAGIHGTAMSEHGQTYDVALSLDDPRRSFVVGRQYVVALSDVMEVAE